MSDPFLLQDPFKSTPARSLRAIEVLFLEKKPIRRKKMFALSIPNFDEYTSIEAFFYP